MGTPNRRALAAAGAIAILAVALPASPAAAATKTAKPGVSGAAWYWEEQHQQGIPNPQGGDAATIELTNPFCPGPPGNVGSPEPTCKSGRLPVEVRGGDYKSPNMISAVGFDLMVAPLGSKVKKFTVTLKEADDAQSKPINVDGHQVRACLVREFFGDGEARRYKEAPKFKCSKSDPVGKRKKVPAKKKGGDPTFEWTFDLTKFAQSWVAKGAPATAVMLTPVEPKKAGASDNNWRVVFTGAAKPEEHGVVTTLVYEPATLPDPLGDLELGDLGGTGGSGSGGSGGFGSTAGSSFTGSSGSSAAAPSGDGGTGPTAAEAPAEETNNEALASAETEGPPAPIGMPWYLWLGILAGIAGFTLVRNFVLESTTGVRPNGVLAQIHQMNARRRGTAATTAGGHETSPLAALRGGLASATAGLSRLGGHVRAFAGKLGVHRK